MAEVITANKIILRFTVFNGEKKKLETLDTDNMYSMEQAVGCLRRSIEVMMQGSAAHPSDENCDQTYRLFGLKKKSHLYTFHGIFLVTETQIVRDPKLVGIK